MCVDILNFYFLFRLFISCISTINLSTLENLAKRSLSPRVSKFFLLKHSALSAILFPKFPTPFRRSVENVYYFNTPLARKNVANRIIFFRAIDRSFSLRPRRKFASPSAHSNYDFDDKPPWGGVFNRISKCNFFTF